MFAHITRCPFLCPTRIENRRALVAQPGPSPRHNVVAQLAAMEMRIYSTPQPSGGLFLWTWRDSIGRAAARAELDSKEYKTFLSAIGEEVVWPD